MSLEPGTTLGPYQVTAKIGEGGMGEVYRARDTKLDRDVALKVLPQAFTDDPDRLARFEREAKVLASLNHPNIGHIYGLEEAEGQKALVLELIEGPTLADRIKHGPITVDEALPIAKQIAEALEAAHEQGIIHRDLKPANIKVKEDGTVKVLDFGLAKAMEGSGGDVSESPTVTAAATAAGVILGTAAYMSPEQARGKPVDKRADIWAFGVVLYEMLTGKRPFEGRDVSETLGAVLRLHPDWEALPGNTPLHLNALLKRCLEKEPRQRVQAVGDVRLAMEGAFGTAATISTEPTIGQRRNRLPWVAGAALAVVSSLTVWTVMLPDAVPAEVMRFAINLPETAPIAAEENDPVLAISPDGTRIVYISISPSGPQLYVQRIGELLGEPLRGGEGGRNPFFSPDGEWIGFESGTSIKKVPSSGGQPVTLTDPAGDGLGYSWRTDDQIVFGNSTMGLFRLPANGGEAEAVSALEGSSLGHALPDVIPGRNAVLVATAPNMPVSTLGELAVVDLDTGDVKQLGIVGTTPRYTSTGHLVYGAAGGVIRAVPFDAASLEAIGDPVQLVEGVVDTGIGLHFSLSDSGTLVFVSGESTWGGQGSALVWVDQDQREEPLPLPVGTHESLAVSPDGKQIASVNHGFEGQDLWVYDVVSGLGQKLTQGFVVHSLAWTPEGDRIIFGSNHEAPANIYSVSADGSDDPQRLLDNEEWDYPWSVSSDGRKVVFERSFGGHRAEHSEIWELDLGGGEEATPLLQGNVTRRNPEYSPDGHWLAYQSNESGTREIYVQPYPNPGRVVPVSAGGAANPMWATDGSQLFYVQDSRVMAVPFDPGGAGPIGSPTVVFESDWVIASGEQDTAPDGRLLLRKPDASAERITAQIIVVQNWFEELKERVPVPIP